MSYGEIKTLEAGVVFCRDGPDGTPLVVFSTNTDRLPFTQLVDNLPAHIGNYIGKLFEVLKVICKISIRIFEP